MSAGASLLRRRSGIRLVSTPFPPVVRTVASHAILTPSPWPRHRDHSHYPTTRHHVYKTTHAKDPSFVNNNNNNNDNKDVRKPWYKSHSSGTKHSGRHQWEAWLRQREEFQSAYETYQSFWNPSTTWTDLADFSHPSLADVTWEQLVASEESYKTLLSLCNECLVQLGSLSSIPHHTNYDDNDEDDDYSTSFLKPPSIMANHQIIPYPTTHNDIDAQVLQSFRQLLTFWERIRRERATMVRALQPAPNQALLQEKQSPGVTSTVVEDKTIIGKWIKKLVGSETTTHPPTTQPKDPTIVQAHDSARYAPSHYHYTRFIARLYYRYPNYGLTPDMWYLRRAQEMQEVIDSAPTEDVLSRKALSWLIRAYAETGKWEQCQAAEDNVYRRFPPLQRYLLKYMLTSYWLITSNARTLFEKHGEDHPEVQVALQEAGQATIRCMELLLQTRLGCSIRERLLPLGFHCLVNVPPRTLDNYHDLVESLTRRKFGRNLARKLLEPSPGHTGELRPTTQTHLQAGDEDILHLLIQIHLQETPTNVSDTSTQQQQQNQPPQQLEEQQERDREKFDERLERTKHLMEILFANYSLLELEDVVSRDTFNLMLRNLVIWGKYRRRWNEREAHFAFALKLLQRMLMCENWRPTTETWDYLFDLAKDGRQSDEVWSKYEVYSFLMEEQGISPLNRTKRVLQAWAKTAKRFPDPSNWAFSLNTTADAVPLPVHRAWSLFHYLYSSSTPPFFYAHNPTLVNHLYNHDNAPDHVVYALVWQICAQFGAWDIAYKVYQMAQEQKQRGDLNFLAGANVAFLQCLPFCPNEGQKRALAQEIMQYAIENDQDIDLAFQTAMEKVDRKILLKYLRTLA